MARRKEDISTEELMTSEEAFYDWLDGMRADFLKSIGTTPEEIERLKEKDE